MGEAGKFCLDTTKILQPPIGDKKWAAPYNMKLVFGNYG